MRLMNSALAMLLAFATPARGEERLSAATPDAAPEQAPTAATVCVAGDDSAGTEQLISALDARGQPAFPCRSDEVAAWEVSATGLVCGPLTVEIRAADGTHWSPLLAVREGAGTEERARAIAVAAAAVLRLMTAGRLPLLPPPAEGTGTGAAAGVRPEIVPSGIAAGPSAAPAEPAVLWGIALSAGAAGNIEGETGRNGTGVALGLRVDATLRHGIWLALDFGWTLVQERRAALLSLHTGTPRLVAGLSVGPPAWAIRFGLGWAVEGWWTVGGAKPRGWRMGGTMVLSACWRPLDWLSVGGELGMDLFRTRIEVDYGSEPLFGLGHWRWRAGLWAAAQFEGL